MAPCPRQARRAKVKRAGDATATLTELRDATSIDLTAKFSANLTLLTQAISIVKKQH